jgi:lysyl-tRNA synthetase class 2
VGARTIDNQLHERDNLLAMRQRLEARVDAAGTSRRERIDRERHQKMRQLRLRGEEPFPDARVPTRSLAAEIHAEHDPRALEVGEHPQWRYTVAGRLMARRKHRHATFYDLRDQSGVVELCVRRDTPDKARCSPLVGADLGDILTAEGALYVTDNHALTISVASSRLVAKALRLPPGGGARAGSEPRDHQKDLSLLASEPARRRVEDRSVAAMAIRTWMAERSFVETIGPTIDALAARPLAARSDACTPMGSSRFSPRLNFRRCLLGGLERVYVLDDRSEGYADGATTLLDWAGAYFDYGDAARQVEEIIQRVAMAIAPDRFARGAGMVADLTRPWQTVTLRESIATRCGLDVLSADAAALASLAPPQADPTTHSWGSLVNGIYATRVEPELMRPTIVRDFPLVDQTFARKHPECDKLACNFVAVIGGVAVAGGDSELNDPHEQRARLVAEDAAASVHGDRDAAHRDREVRLLEYGLCPAAYATIDVDRLLSVLTGESSRRSTLDLSRSMTNAARLTGFQPVSAA